MEKHNLELNSACSSNYLEPHTNNSNKRAFDYEHANSAMNYKVAEEELVVSIKVIIYKGGSHISFSKSFFYINNQLDPSANDVFNIMIFLLALIITLTFQALYFLKLCPIFIGSLDKFVAR